MLQIWGGAGYFLARFLLFRAEFVKNDRALRLAGWIIYLLALPAWAVLLAGSKNWIACAIEIAVIPVILLGIVCAARQNYRPNRIIDRIIKLFACVMITAGIACSVYTFKGVKTVSQILELTLIFGYLAGNYLLAQRNPFAYLMFMLRPVCMGLLMYVEAKPLLSLQQAISLAPALLSFIRVMKKTKGKKPAAPPGA